MPNRPAGDHLEGLRARVAAGGEHGLTPAEHEELQRLLDRAGRDGARDDPGLAESLEEAALRFEARHPSVSAALRTVGVNLANLGI
ncbi:hypothetical protein C0216_16280 [Streptomyces globosus]|uniref:DUF4404 domain-containing protein n=1 Tax=Streptomyces globosus TaxID=68209 RepID=A0A344U1M8_9ACTN|nr:DUF4404 family protein [Streptomyces globosus]AXE24799.1 hypothetical protein C0216_16280 [Streptomyces globosus]